VNLVNLGALSSKIDGIQALGRAFSLVFAIKASFWCNTDICPIEAKSNEEFVQSGHPCQVLGAEVNI
jgi:hypothetical protein